MPAVPVVRVTLSLALCVILGDWLLWHHSYGMGYGLYAIVLCGLIWLSRARAQLKSRHLLISGLLVLSAVQTAIRPSLCNFVAILAMLLLLAGDSWYTQISHLSSRWIRAAIGLPAFVYRWIDYAKHCRQFLLGRSGLTGRAIVRLWEVSWLGLVLVIVFSVFLALGNERFGEFVWEVYDWVYAALLDLSLPSILHILFWFVLATLGLVLFLPAAADNNYEAWVDKDLERYPCKQMRVALVRTAIALVGVNVLFLFNNSLDVVHLWVRQELPAGMGGRYSDYVHDGVYSLIFAVMLSASVLALLFQQQERVVQSKLLKSLGMLWVVQNLFLALGVLLRLKLYVDAHWLTPKRVYVALFLGLIAVGYVLLSRYILKSGNLKKLMLSNMLAVVGYCFVLQFINVPALVADYNFRQWRETPERSIERMEMGKVLGREMVPMLVQVVGSGETTSAVAEARRSLKQWQLKLAAEVEQGSWQEYQWRRVQLISMANAALEGK